MSTLEHETGRGAEPAHVNRTPGGKQPLPRKVIASAALGNFIEWYDLAIFAYAAVAIGHTFFADASPTVQLLSSFGALAITYLTRPLAGLVLGVIGDKLGRKSLLVFTILVMGLATTVIGLLPGSDTLGSAAPIILIGLRMLQGIGAGGEFMGAATYVLEHTSKERRGYAMSLIQLGTGLCYPTALFLAYALVEWRGVDWFNDGGWRILFLISAPLTLVALYIRNGLHETPVFKEMQRNNTLATNPARELFAQQKFAITGALMFMFNFAINAGLFLFYLPVYLGGRTNLDASSVRMVMVIALLGFALSIPGWGLVIDRISRHTARFSASLVGLCLPIPVFLAASGSSVAVIAVGMLVYGLLVGLLYAITPLTSVEAVPARVRFTGASLVHNVGLAVITGTCPLVAQSLINVTGSDMSPAYYATVLTALSLIGAVMLSRPARVAAQTA